MALKIKSVIEINSSHTVRWCQRNHFLYVYFCHSLLLYISRISTDVMIRI